jgi:cytochrome P450
MPMVGLNPFAPAYISDPYPLYQELRALGPVSTDFGWILSCHADVMAALTNESIGHLETVRGDLPYRVLQRMFIRLNRIDHARIRSAIAPLFTPRGARAMEQRVRERAAQILSRGWQSGGLDVVSDLAHPLATATVAELLGIDDREEIASLQPLTRRLAKVVDPAMTSGELGQVERAGVDLIGHITRLIERRAAGADAPGGEVVANLLAAERESGLTREDSIATCVLLLLAGVETTTALIGGAVLALLRQPDAMAWLRANPHAVLRSVDEFARYDSPTQRSTRIALADVDVNGTRIRAGETMLVLFGSANRDPDAFPDPDSLDFDRKLGHHLGFGRGMHFCLGAHIARSNGAIVLTELLKQTFYPGIAFDELRWRDMYTIRSLASLPVIC